MSRMSRPEQEERLWALMLGAQRDKQHAQKKLKEADAKVLQAAAMLNDFIRKNAH
jgi:hypothetical protein